MGGLITILAIFLVFLAGFGLFGFFTWRRVLRFAKGVERGIKMVPILISLPPPSDDVEVGGRDVREVIQERISQAEILYNLIAGTTQKGFKSKFYGQRHISLEIVAINGVIRFYAAVPVVLVPVVKQAVQTAYPGAQLVEVQDHNVFNPSGKLSATIGGEVVLKEPYSYPIATFTQLKRDAMQAMINAFTTLEKGDGAAVQILLRPAASGWTKSSQGIVSSKKKGKDKSGISARELLNAPFKVPEEKKDDPQDKQLTSLEQATLDSIEEKTKHPGYEVLIRVIASSSTASRSQAILHNIVAAFALFDSPGLNGFKFSPAKDMESFVTAFIFRFFPPEVRSTILNSVELATLFHFPDYQFTHTSQVERQFSKQVDGPSKLSKDGLLLGHNIFRGVKKEIRLSPEDRRRHVYIVGQTGTGKSTLLENLAIQDMLNGNGVAFIDPHGDTAERLLSMVPKNRTEDVIYFDPGDMNYPLGLNMFEFQTHEQKDFLIQEAINMLYRLYDPQHQGIIGPRYEHLFRNAALTVMADPAGGTFIDIPKLFNDQAYVRKKLQHVTDATVLDFWNKEMPASQRSNEFGEVKSWFVSKFGAFLSNEMMRNIIGQPKSSFDLRDIMDNQKILIVNLSKGRVGELNSMLLGMIFVSKFQAAAMSRANIPEPDRRDFALYVDEFQNFSTESFAHILSEARKYHLNLIVANQFVSQLSEEIREAVFGNVGTVLGYRVGPNDADFLVKQFAPIFDTRDLVNLPNFTTVIRLMIAGLPSQPFSLVMPPALGSGNPQLGIALKQLSAAKYGKPRSKVEAEIFKRLESPPEVPSPFGSGSISSPYSTSGTGMAPPSPSPGPRMGGPAPMPAGSSGSSFLDEWLAKRRQEQSGPARAQNTQAGPTPPTSAPSQAPNPSISQTTPTPTELLELEHRERVLTPPPEGPSIIDRAKLEMPEEVKPIVPPKPLYQHEPKPKPKIQHVKGAKLQPVKKMPQPISTPKPVTRTPQTIVPSVSSNPLTFTQDEIRDLQATASQKTQHQKAIEDVKKQAVEKDEKDSEDLLKSKMKTMTKSQLQPGEIYVDEEGMIHEAGKKS